MACWKRGKNPALKTIFLPMCESQAKAKKLLAPHIDTMQDIHRKLAELAGRYAAECEL